MVGPAGYFRYLVDLVPLGCLGLAGVTGFIMLFFLVMG